MTAPASARSIVTSTDFDQLDFTKSGGLVTVVTQDATTGAVLMVAHADREAMELTLSTGEMHYSSRTRGLWHKGATSGNTQRVVSLSTDCDGDAVLALVRPSGPACHEGSVSCFRGAALVAGTLQQLDATLAERAASLTAETANVNGESAQHSGAETRTSWTHRLLADRNLRHKKLGEEAVELTMACLDGDREAAAAEGADLIYHTLVALRAVDVSLGDVLDVLASRASQR